MDILHWKQGLLCDKNRLQIFEEREQDLEHLLTSTKTSAHDRFISSLKIKTSQVQVDLLANYRLSQTH